MASFSRCAVLLVAMLFAALSSPASAVVYNYTAFFNPVSGCSVTVGQDGNIYIGLCSAGTILKLSSTYAAQTTYNTQVQKTLLPYQTNAINILELYSLGISGDTTLWFRDVYNQRVLGVDSTSGTNVKNINLVSVGGAEALGVSPYSANIWVGTPGASTGTATIQQYDTNGNLISTISSSNDATNLPSLYFVLGVQPDPTGTLVYVGGCLQPTANTIQYTPGSGFEYPSAPNSFTCDIRAINIASSTVQLPYLTVNAASNAYYGSTNEFFFQKIAVRAASSLNGMYGAGTVFAYDSGFTGVTFAWQNGTNLQIANFTGPTASPSFTPQNNFVFIGAKGESVQQYNGQQTSSVYNISTLTFTDPEFVAVGPGGSPVYAASEYCGPLAVMNAQAQITSYIGGGNTGLTCAGVTAVDASGNVFVIDEIQNAVYKFSSSGAYIMNFSAPNTYIGDGLCVDPNNGNIYAPADNATAYNLGQYGVGFVIQWSSTGQLLGYLGGSITYPFACAVTSSSQVIVTGANLPGTVNSINPTSGVVTTFSNPPGVTQFEVLGATISADGRIFVSALNFGLYVYSSTGTYIDLISSPSEDIYAYNLYYTPASGGLVYVADLFNARIVTFNVGTSGTGNGTGRTNGTVPIVGGASTAGNNNGNNSGSSVVSGLAATVVLTVAALIATMLIGA